jgi:hypothetical protein
MGAHGAGAPDADGHALGIVAAFAVVARQHFARQLLPTRQADCEGTLRGSTE